MQRVFLRPDGPVFCPECETDLDEQLGVCPACRWDRSWITAELLSQHQSDETFSERYRGTPFDSQLTIESSAATGVERGRVFVIVGLLAVLVLMALLVDAFAIV